MPIRLLVLKVHHLRKAILPYLWLILCLAFGAGMVSFPATVFVTAKNGLHTWWNIVVPSLLPFFIISELLIRLGFVSFLGKIMEPVMKPLFNLPGTSGFILGVSYLSGSPLCAILTARLRKEGLCTKEEGERLIAFTSNASPLFLLGAVSVGMLKDPNLGPYIASIHYLSNLFCGLLLKLLSKKKQAQTAEKQKKTIASSLENPFPQKSSNFGLLLGETVRNATTTLLTIGGFIALFSVLVGIMQSTGIFSLILKISTPIAKLINFDVTLVRSLLYGFFEMTIGVNEASKSSADLLQQLIAIEAILAWNGLSIHAQVAGMISGTDLTILPYLFARLLQVFLAVLLTCLLSPFLPCGQHVPATALSQPAVFWNNIALTLGIVILSIAISLGFFHISKRIFTQFSSD
ncbi:MAG: sporulation integral membrane protein YlbJ [Thermacetogeniaceae bacterium]